MKKLFIASLICATAIGFIGCSNGDYDANPATNNSNIKNPLIPGGGNGGTSVLTTGSWKLTAATLTSGTQTTDLYALIDECERDNIFTFNSNNTLATDEGATKCSASDPQTKTDGIWNISGNKITITDPSGSQQWDIVTLDNTTFKITYTGTINGTSATATQTYSRP